MEKNFEALLKEFEQKLEVAESAIKALQEQADKRVDARIREAEVQARILEAQTNWRPKDWFILSGIVGAIIGFIATLLFFLVLAFSYVPRTTTTTTTTTSLEGVSHKVDTVATDNASNTTEANFTIE